MKSYDSMQQFSGILLIDKPSGKTSHDIVDLIRKKFHIKKVGHAGTLDPMATGLLVILLGKATKKSKDFIQDNKTYRAQVSLGKKTDTMDAMGKVTQEVDLSGIQFSSAAIEAALKKFVGHLKQVPPMFSAIKHKGKRLYKLARQGIEIERKARDIFIHKIRLLNFNWPYFDVEIECSKGTYVRVLCEQIGDAVGIPAHMSKLCRIKSGDFDLADAVSIDQIDCISSLAELRKIDAYISWN